MNGYFNVKNSRRRIEWINKQTAVIWMEESYYLVNWRYI